jgi:ABC-type glycerol-3-phosphate transport system permease component
MRELGLLDTLPALMLIYAAVNIPLSVWLLKTYFDTVPLSLDEAAAMDGCSRLRILFSIIAPVSLPGLAATALFSFIACWNEFYLALVLCSSVRSSTMPIGLFMFQSSYDIKWNLLGAASIVAMLPVIVLFIAFQEQFVAGLTKGAVKE